MKRNVLSMFPYFGGKAHMAPLICDMLDYEHTNTFVTPFGGACRVLLNKPRHQHECYGDLSEGLCTFVKLMSSSKTAIELIHTIYNTEYSQAQFDWAKRICYLAEKDPLDRMIRARNSLFKRLLLKYGVMSSKHQNLLKVLEKDEKNGGIELFQELSGKLTASEKKQLESYSNEIEYIYQYIDIQGATPNSRDYAAKYVVDEAKNISDLELAVATYVRYIQSRDAMGKTWSNTKYKTPDNYYRQMSRLYDVADRLQGIYVFQMDANYFYSDYVKQFFGWNKDWLENPDVMMCCDPSYISPESEIQVLKIRDEVKKGLRPEKDLKIQPKNLGTSYEASFTYEDHEAFIKSIYKAKCKMIVCNYDLQLYNNYLTPAGNWKRIEYATKTSVGGKKNNNRTEVLWYNY